MAKSSDKPKPSSAPKPEGMPWDGGEDGQEFADGPPTQPFIRPDAVVAEPPAKPATPPKLRRLGDEGESTSTELEPKHQREPTQPAAEPDPELLDDGPATLLASDGQLEQAARPGKAGRPAAASVTEPTSVPSPAFLDPRKTSGPKSSEETDPSTAAIKRSPAAPRKPSNPEAAAAEMPRRPSDPKRPAVSRPPTPPPTPEPARKPTRGATPAVEPRKPTRSAVPAAGPPKSAASNPAMPRRITRNPAPSGGPEDQTGVSAIGEDASARDDEAEESTRPAGELPKQKLSEAGAFSRKQGKAEAAEKKNVFENTATGLKTMDPRSRRALGVVVGLSVVVVGGVLAFGLITALRDRPEQPELQLAYPYGFDGMMGPHGERAPGAAKVSYRYLEEVTCQTHTVCLRYRYSGEGGFEGTMIVGKTRDGQWVGVGTDGMPFIPLGSR